MRAAGVAAVLGLCATFAATTAQATILRCTGSPDVDTYWDLSPYPSAAFWKDGQWMDARCGAWNGFNWKCDATPEIYRLEFFVADSPGSSTAHSIERWEINRSTGAFLFRTWVAQGQQQPTREVRGTCAPSAAPTVATPKF